MPEHYPASMGFGVLRPIRRSISRIESSDRQSTNRRLQRERSTLTALLTVPGTTMSGAA